jgi:hypothetical protein
MVLEPERTALLADLHQSKVVLESADRKVAADMGDTSWEWALAPTRKGEKMALAPARKGGEDGVGTGAEGREDGVGTGV